MSIYRLYIQNGNVAGFWIQHRNWPNQCAQVMTIAGQRSGRLPGVSPSHDNASVSVRRFDIRSGRPVPGVELTDPPEDRRYVLIAAPPWFRDPTEAFPRSEPRTPSAKPQVATSRSI